ncbi:MAG: DUF308 domain-containing protein [Rikenellaceae bacterium]|nr:DUF308 domain-containing protein [Rikenellaceae bacterium]
MKRFFRENQGIWTGIFSIVLGIIMVAWPGLTTRMIVVILGILLMLTGLLLAVGFLRRRSHGTALRMPLTPSISFLVGLSMVAMPQLFIHILMIVFGILLTIGGIDQLVSLATARRYGLSIPWFFFITPAVILLIGLYIMFSPSLSASGFMMLFGITAIVFGVIVLYDEHMLNRAVKTVQAIEVHDEEESF